MRIEPTTLYIRLLRVERVREAVRACEYARGPIPFSRYLEKHNRQDRDDLSRTALPLFGEAVMGKVLDVRG